MPERIQLSRRAGWRMPPDTLKVDRSTRWGNPCTVEDYGSAEQAVLMFEHELEKASVFHPDDFETYLAPLRGKNLACWCSPGAPCHADVLLRLANAAACEGAPA